MNDTAAVTQKKGLQTKWLILSAVMLGSIMGPLDGSIVNTVLPSIARYFDAPVSVVQWVPTVYLLTISCLILLYGRIGDMIGYKKVYLGGFGGVHGHIRPVRLFDERVDADRLPRPPGSGGRNDDVRRLCHCHGGLPS